MLTMLGATNIGDDDVRTARKRLMGVDGVVMVRGQPVPNLAGKVPSTVLLLEGGNDTGTNAQPSTSTPGKAPIVKRRKQGEEGNVGDTNMTDEAASFEGDRRAQ